MQEWAILGVGVLLSIIGYFVNDKLGQMASSMSDTRKAVESASDSVSELNVKVAVVIERIEYHDERIKKLEERHEFR